MYVVSDMSLLSIINSILRCTIPFSARMHELQSGAYGIPGPRAALSCVGRMTSIIVGHGDAQVSALRAVHTAARRTSDP
jgi:hypothetical protein